MTLLERYEQIVGSQEVNRLKRLAERLGRFTTQEEIDFAADLLVRKVGKLRDLSPLWEMHKDGVDLASVQWAAH